ncbi:MAG: HD domain-containing phosphohydrolase [Thermoanaerobaculia bacterium]
MMQKTLKILAQILIIIVVALVSTSLEKLAQLPLFHVIPGVSLFFPLTAWIIISFYLFGFTAAGGIILGSILAPWNPQAPIHQTFINGLIHCIEGIIPYLILRGKGEDVSLQKHSTLIKFLGLGLLLGTWINASFGSLFQYLRYKDLSGDMILRWFSRWTSDLIAAFAFALPILFLIQPLLLKIPEKIKNLFLDKIHKKPFTFKAIKIKLTVKEYFLFTAVFLLFWSLIFISFSASFEITLIWFSTLFLFPVLYIAIKGGFKGSMYFTAITALGLLFLIFFHGIPKEDPVLLITFHLNLLMIFFAGSAAGILSEANFLKISEIKKLHQFASQMVIKKAAPEVLQELAKTLIETLQLKGIRIFPVEGKPQNWPEDLKVDGDEAKETMLIKADGMTFGTLELIKNDPNPFSEKSINIAESVIRQAAIALDNSRIYENLEFKVKELKALFDVAKALLVTLDINEILKRTITSLSQAFHLSIAYIFLKNKDNTLSLKASSGVEPEKITIKTLKPGEGIIGSCFQTGKVRYSPNVKEDPDYIEMNPGIHSQLAIPLSIKEEVIGVLSLESYLPDAFRAEDIQLIKAVSAQLALAIRQVQLHTELEQAHITLKDTYFETMQALCNAVEAKDKYTQGHVERTATYALEVGIRMGLSEDQLDNLRLASMLHDIGKIGIPEDLLQKSSYLTPREREIIKRHVDIGVQILQEIDFLKPAIPAIYYHQEWYSGYDGVESFGYPVGIKGEEIPIEARIIAVVDSFDAMTSTRPYRKALSWDEAVKRLIIEKGRQFDPAIVDIFIDILQSSYNYRLPSELRYLMLLPPLKGKPPKGYELPEPWPPKTN